MKNKSGRFLLAAGGLVALILLVTLLAWAFVNSESFKSRIEASVSQTLRMAFKIDDPARILLFPNPGLRLADIRVSNAGSEWINASRVDLRVLVRPLLRGQVAVDRIDLVAPNLELKLDSEGAWNFVPPGRPDDPNARPVLRIGHFRVQDASLTFTDQVSGGAIEAQSCEGQGENLGWRPSGPDASEWKLPDLQADLSCGKIIYDMLEVTGLAARVSSQEQRLKISPVTGMLFGGQLKARLESDLSGSSPAHSLELELADFRVEQYIETFQEEPGAEGALIFTAQLSFSGKTPAQVVASLNGRANLSGTRLVLHGLDLDKQLSQYQSTQRFNLVDIAAFFVAGPLGLVVTRGYGFASLFAHRGEQTPIQELIAEWEIENGIARARDVALSTAENRLALAGGLDFVNSRFEDMRVAVIDAEGCAVVKQRIQGEFHDPQIEKPHFLISLVGPLVDIVRRGIGLFKDAECELFYTGRLGLP